MNWIQRSEAAGRAGGTCWTSRGLFRNARADGTDLVQHAALSARSRDRRPKVGPWTVAAHSAAAAGPPSPTHAAAAGSITGRGALTRTGRGTRAHGDDGNRLPG